MIIPPANKSLKGTTVEVWVFVDEKGKVVAGLDAAEPAHQGQGVQPEADPRGERVGVPAGDQGGKAVASWFPYQISM